MVQKSGDHIFQQLFAELSEATPEPAARTFLLDGSSVRAAHRQGLCETFPPGSNQHGESHWPLLRVLVAHDLHTGLAMRPEWGAMHGPEAVSEQGLLETAIERLPDGSTVMGDANFGVFSVAYAATRRRTQSYCALQRSARNGWPENRCALTSTGRWCGNRAGTTARVIRTCRRRPV
jgi:hypothetical protein